MKITAAAALGALILAASAVPALAGGYWDGGIVQSGPPGAPPPGFRGNPCPCYCPRDREGYGARPDDRRAWADHGEDNGGWRDDGARYDDQDDYGAADSSDDGYGGGPGYVFDGYGAGNGGFAGGAVDLEFRDRFGDRDRLSDHRRPHILRHDDHPPSQQRGSTPHLGSWDHAGGHGRPAGHGGGGR